MRDAALKRPLYAPGMPDPCAAWMRVWPGIVNNSSMGRQARGRRVDQLRWWVKRVASGLYVQYGCAGCKHTRHGCPCLYGLP